MKKILIILLLITSFSQAQQLAFPSAIGAGAYTTGGRGGVVVHVTNLNDSGVGSLRAALTMTVPRTIVLDVSGVINLNSILYLDDSNSNFTLAGQSAPKGGLTIDGNRVYFQDTKNFILRYVRFRGGIKAGSERDSFVAYGMQNAIIDHCSFSFGSDEAGSFVSNSLSGSTKNVTIQHCLFAHSKTGSIVGGLDGNYEKTGEVTFYKNLYYNISHRFPNTYGNGRIDVVNNVAWNLQKRIVRANGNLSLNQIGNYYTYNTPIHDKILNHYSYSSGNALKLYTNGNKFVSYRGERTTGGYKMTSSLKEINDDNFLSWKWFIDNASNNTNRGEQLPTSFQLKEPLPLVGKSYNIEDADTAFKSVIANVGANAHLNSDGSLSDSTDQLDALWLSEISQGKYVNYLPKDKWLVPNINSVKRDSNYDTDKDGMPDTWEIANGLNPNKTDSQSNIEAFLNGKEKTNDEIIIVDPVITEYADFNKILKGLSEEIKELKQLVIDLKNNQSNESENREVKALIDDFIIRLIKFKGGN